MKNFLKKLTALSFCTLFAVLASGCNLFASATLSKGQYAQAIGNISSTIESLASNSTEQSRPLSIFFDDTMDIFKPTEFNEVSFEFITTNNILKFIKGILEDPAFELSNEISAFDVLADNSLIYQPINFNVRMKTSCLDNLIEFIFYTNVETGSMEEYTKILTVYNPSNDITDSTFYILLVGSTYVNVYMYENSTFYILDDSKDLSTFENLSRAEFENFKLMNYIEKGYDFDDLYNNIIEEGIMNS